jgi:hypothetical protein
MTEAEFQQAAKNGQINVNPPAPIPDIKDPEAPFDPNQPIIDLMKRPRIYLSAIPTFVPKSFAESIQFVDDGTTKKPYFYINGEWVAGSVASSPIYWFVDAIIGAGATNYIGYQQTGTPESAVQTVIPVSGTISNLYIHTNTAQPASGTAVYTFRKNAADQTVVATVNASDPAGNYSDTTHSFDVVAGDLIDVKVVNNASAAAGKPFFLVFKFTPN